MSTILFSLLTPTSKDRYSFFSRLIDCINNIEYNKNEIEWIILDDYFNATLFNKIKNISYIKYIALNEKKNIGEKRNILNKIAKGEILVNIDDDDFYPPNKLLYLEKKFNENKEIMVSGCSCVFMYYNKIIYIIGPYGKNHATGNTLAYRKEYCKNHFYKCADFAEEKQFLNNYKTNMIQISSENAILVMRHQKNTANKYPLHRYKYVKKTDFKLYDFVIDNNLRRLYI